MQSPAALPVDRVIASVSEATAGQERDWYVDVVVSNSGESDLDLDLEEAPAEAPGLDAEPAGGGEADVSLRCRAQGGGLRAPRPLSR